MPPWTPNMAWPSGTPGGASSPAWGGYVRLWVRAGIAPGNTFHLGQHNFDRLDAGNVLGGAPSGRVGLTERLWVDLSCDVLEVNIAGGATSGQGIFAKADAMTLTATIADPEGIYDPLYKGGPFSYGGHSRLVPGAPIEVFAEVVNGDDGTWARYPIFTGTADSWAEDWVPRPWNREAKVVATDATKIWARYNAPEQASQGAGETVGARINRIVSFFAWPGTVDASTSTRTLDATTLAQPGWEMLNRTLDDELGVIYFTAAGHLRWLNRETFTTVTAPRIKLGCKAIDSTARDVLTDTAPEKTDLQLRNDVYAARTGGTEQHQTHVTSIENFGPYPYRRTDLGLADDTQVGAWASFVIQLYSFPQVGLENVTMVPAIDPRSWELWQPVLDWKLYTDIAHITWAPPDLPTHVIEGEVRVVGVKHRIDRGRWELEWQTIAARPLSLSGVVFHMGPATGDRLDSGYLLA